MHTKPHTQRHQLHRQFGITWFWGMLFAKLSLSPLAFSLGALRRFLEADKTELSPSCKRRPRSGKKRLVRILERGGQVRANVLGGVDSGAIRAASCCHGSIAMVAAAREMARSQAYA
jgi:hypothetical protein